MVCVVSIRWTDPSSGEQHHTEQQLPLTIGREPGVAVVVADRQVSRRHAAIREQDGRIVLIDLQSTNGTFVDGERVTSLPLGEQATVQVGSTRLNIHCQRFAPSSEELAPPSALPSPATVIPVPPVVDTTPLALAPADLEDADDSGMRTEVMQDSHQIGVFGDERLAQLAWSPDGKQIALVGTSQIVVRDAQSLLVQQTLVVTAPITAISFAQGGAALAVVSGHGLDVWHLAGGTPLAFPLAAAAHAVNLTFANDGGALALDVGEGVEVVLFGAATATHLLPIDTAGPSGCVALALGGHVLAAATPEGIELWEVVSERLIGRLPLDPERLIGLAFDPEAQRLVIVEQRCVRIWNTVNGTVQTSFACATGWIEQVCFAPDGHTFAIITGNEAQVRQLHNGHLVQRLALSAARPSDVAFSPDGEALAVALGPSLEIWRIADRILAFEQCATAALAEGLAFLPDGDLLTAGGAYLSRWRAPAEQVWQRLDPILAPLRAMVGSASLQLLATLSRDCVAVWRAEEGVLFIRRPGQFAQREGVAIDTADQIALWVEPTAVGICTIKERQIERIAVAGLALAQEVALAPDTGRVALALNDAVEVWQLAPQLLLATIRCADAVDALAFTPDSSLLAVAADVITFWRPGERAAHGQIDQRAERLVFSPDGALLAAAWRGSVNIWRVADCRLLASVPLGNASLLALRFAPDASTLAGAFADGVVRLWTVG